MRAIVKEAIVLAKAAAFVTKAAPSRTTIPILDCMRIAIISNRLELIATDLDLSHHAVIEVTDAADGVAVVPAARLAGLVSALPADAQVELVLEEGALRIQSGRGRWRLPTLSEGDFPPPLTVDNDAVTFTLPAADARTFCDRLRYAVSEEETRFYLGGVNVQEQHGRLVCVATDGHQLAEVTLEVDPGRVDLNIIIPADTIETLKMLSGLGDVEVAIDAMKIALVAGQWSAASKLIDGTFPDYARVIPQASSNCVTVPRPELLAALKRLKGVADSDSEKVTSVGLTWDDHKRDVEVCLPRDAANVETLEGSAVSGAAAVAVKLDYLVETLEALSRPVVCFDHGQPGSPLIVTEPDDPLEPALALIMPLSVPEWRREEPPTTKADVRKFKAKPRASAKAPTPEPEDAA